MGLSLLFASRWAGRLSRGLPFAPVSSIVGGLLNALGMVIARSCVSGLLCKLGSGMAGTTLGLAGWVAGELVASVAPTITTSRNPRP